MGNHHGHHGGGATTTDGGSGNGVLAAFSSRKSLSRNSSSRKLSRTSSGPELPPTGGDHNHQQKAPAQPLLPLEKLAKILAQKSHAEEGIVGIGLTTFTRYLFPRYPILAERLYQHFNVPTTSSNGATHHRKLSITGNGHYKSAGAVAAPGAGINAGVFKAQCDKFFMLGLHDDAVRDTLVRMFSDHPSSDSCNGGSPAVKSPEQKQQASSGVQDDEHRTISADGLKQLLMCAYHISMDHYSEGPQMCLTIAKTLAAVVDSCYHGKQTLSVQFVAHWLRDNCPRLLCPVYRYAVHSLATSYRTLEPDGPSLAAAVTEGTASVMDADFNASQGLELTTPVLEQPSPFGNKNPHPHLLQMSISWLLAGALPPMYSRPQKAHSPSNSGVGLSSAAFLSKLLCAVPSHWLILYDSDEMGLGSNRFLHHVMAYRGPTLCLLKAEGGAVFCIAAACEWRESHLYWGGEECAVFQLLPKFLLLEQGSKMLYLNPTVRGYPLGLRAGSDPRAPIIAVDGAFERLEFRKIPYALQTIEVWGCGDAASRDVQLDIKKWQVREAERQRIVKLSADDWLDHPDRYLLELAGRPQYNQQHLENCSS